MSGKLVFTGLVLGSACLLLTAPARADIFMCLQADGVPLFTNLPRDARCQLQRQTKGSPSISTTALESRIARRIPQATRSRYDEHVQAAARTHGVEAALIHAVISAESAYDPLARSAKGARGLMQLIPETASRYGVTNPFDPQQNIDGGTRYLKDLLGMFGNDLRLALAAYNAGEGAVMRYGKVPPYEETLAYVPRVLAYYKRYRAPATKTALRVAAIS